MELRGRYARAARQAHQQVGRSINRALALRGLTFDGQPQTNGEVLGLVLDRARALFGGCGSVSLTVVEQLNEEHPRCRTAAATGIAEAVDITQYWLGEGPCVEAVELDMFADVRADDLTTADAKQAWPRFSRATHEAGVRSSLSIGVPWSPLRVGLHPEGWALGAINFYADKPCAFGQTERDATMFGCWAEAIVSGADPAELLRAGA